MMGHSSLKKIVLKVSKNELSWSSREFKNIFWHAFIQELQFTTIKACHRLLTPPLEFWTLHSQLGGCHPYWLGSNGKHAWWGPINRQKHSSELKIAISKCCHKCWCMYFYSSEDLSSSNLSLQFQESSVF